jgi:hypothetical protein
LCKCFSFCYRDTVTICGEHRQHIVTFLWCRITCFDSGDIACLPAVYFTVGHLLGNWRNWGTILEFAWRGQGKPWLEQQASWRRFTLGASHIPWHSVTTTATYLVHYSALLNVAGSFMGVYKTQRSAMTWWRLKHVVGQGIHLKVLKYVVQFLGLGKA